MVKKGRGEGNKLGRDIKIGKGKGNKLKRGSEQMLK